MKIQHYHQLLGLQANRRNVLKGAAATAAMSTGVLGTIATALAQDDLRTQLLQIPGVGAGQPTDADFQKVGELCLGATKQSVKRFTYSIPQSSRSTSSWSSRSGKRLPSSGVN